MSFDYLTVFHNVLQFFIESVSVLFKKISALILHLFREIQSLKKTVGAIFVLPYVSNES